MSRVAPMRAATATSTRPLTCCTGSKLSGSTSARYSGSTPPMAPRGAALDGGGVALARRHGVLGGPQGAREGQRAVALAGIQPPVAARHRQPVGFADRRHDVERDREVEVAHHAAHDGDLLGVLLAEERHVGRDDVEELGHHRADAGEMAGAAVGALEHVGQALDADGGREARRVDLLGRRGEEHVDAELGRLGRVARLVARIGGQVGRLLELGGVDEQRHDDLVAAIARDLKQCVVAAVEGAHGGHEADRAAGGAGLARRGAHLGVGADEPHVDGHRPRGVREDVEEVEQLGRAIGDGRTLAGYGLLVPACDRPGERVGGTALGPVLDRRADERGEHRAVDPGGRRQPLGRALERHEEVGRDRSRRVVGDAILFGDPRGVHAEHGGQALGDLQRPLRRAVDRAAGTGQHAR